MVTNKKKRFNKLTRILKLYTIIQSGRKYGVQDLMDMMSVSRRTLFRDLKELAEIGVPYNFDRQKGQYSIDPEFFLPPIDLTVNEALSLLLMSHKMRTHVPVPFQKASLLAAIKIENNLPLSLRQYCRENLEKVSVKPSRSAGHDEIDQVFASIQKAISEKRFAKIQYKSLFEKEQIQTTLKPYHIVFNHRAWYVIGHSSMHDEIRTFKLSRIKKLSLQLRRFADGDDFDIAQYYGRAWSMIPEGKLWTVKLRFDSMVAKNVTEVRWHATQESQINPDGSADVEFRVDGLGEISWWLLGYGDKVKVLAPQELRRSMLKTAKNMVKNLEK